jgi:hypothetical protein
MPTATEKGIVQVPIWKEKSTNREIPRILRIASEPMNNEAKMINTLSRLSCNSSLIYS